MTLEPGARREVLEHEPRITVGRFLGLSEATTARALLESHGLRPTLRDVSMAGLDWQLVPALGGVRLEVPRSEARVARELLAAGDRRVARLHDAGEVEYFEAARRRRRWVGVTAMFLLSPWFGLVGWLLGRRAATREGDPPADT